jgi:hypothetical protein
MVCIDLDTNVVFGTVSHAYKLRKDPTISKTFNVQLSEENKNDWLNKAIGCGCADFFCPINFVAEFSELCAKNTEIKVAVTNENREIHFNNSGVFLSLPVIGSLDVVSKNVTTRILNTEIVVLLHLMKDLRIEDWTVKGTANIYKSKLSADSPIIGKIDEDVLDKLWESNIRAKIEEWVAELAGPGIPLPSLKFAHFYNTQIGFNGPFVRFCSDVDIKYEI